MSANPSPLNHYGEYEKADRAIDLGYHDKAIEIAGRILSDNPDDDQAYILIARAQTCKHNYEAAEAALTQAMAINPEDAYAHFLYAAILWDKRKLRKAEEEFRHALELNPWFDWAWARYGRFLLEERKNHQKAEECMDKALSINPDEPTHHLHKAYLLEERNRFDEAETHYKIALKLAPNDFRCLNDYGHFLLQYRNKPVDAFPLFREALRLHPTDKIVQENLLLCFKAKSPGYNLYWTLRQRLFMATRTGWGMAMFVFVFVALKPVALLWILLCILMWFVDQLFAFAFRQGWIR